MEESTDQCLIDTMQPFLSTWVAVTRFFVQSRLKIADEFEALKLFVIEG